MMDYGALVQRAAERRAEIAAEVRAAQTGARAAARARCGDCLIEAADLARAWARSFGMTLTYLRQHLTGA